MGSWIVLPEYFRAVKLFNWILAVSAGVCLLQLDHMLLMVLTKLPCY